MAIFSISDVKKFKQCRQLADFSLTSRMGLQPKTPAIYYAVGSMAHEALEQYYNGAENAWDIYEKDALKALKDYRSAPFYDKLESEVLSFKWVLMAYMKRWAKANDTFTILNTEVRDIIELPNGHHFTFKYDGLVTKRDGSVWIKEFKTTRSLPRDLGWLQIDEQAGAYQWAVEEITGIPIVGSIYTWIRKKEPTIPGELPSGGMQERSNIVTTADVYYKAIIDNGYSPTDYKDFLKYLTAKEGDDFFLRTEVRTSPKQRKLTAKHLNEITEVMGDEHTLMYASPSQQNCTGCAFFGPCSAKLLGLNYKALLVDDYEQGGYY